MMVKVPEKFLMMRSPFRNYGVMILAVVAALLLGRSLLPVFDPSAFTFFYAAVAVSAWCGGIEVGMLAIALSAILALYFLIEPVYTFEILSLRILVRLTTFSLVSLLITALFSELQTARRKAESSLKLLQNSEMRFSRLAESNIIGVIVSNLNGCIIEANEAFLKMVGYTREDLSAKRIDWRQITAPEYLVLSQRSVEELRTTGVCKPFEKEYICKDGSRVPVLLGSVVVEDTEETVIGFVVDLSDRKQALSALQQANERVTRTLESMSDGFISLDQDWRIIYQNAAAERINGKPRTEVIGKLHWEEWTASVGTNLERQYRRAMTEQISVYFEHHYYLPSKYDLWLEIHAYPSKDGLDIFFRDISDRKQVEQTLRDQEERLKLANERFELAAAAVNCLIYDWDIKQDIVERTEGLTRILGYSLDIAGKNGNWWRELIHPEDLQRVDDDAGVAWANGDAYGGLSLRYSAEYRVRNQDNQYVYVLDQGIVVKRDADGNPARVVGSTTDISERKQIEEALQEQERKYRYIFEATGVSIFEEDFSRVKAALDDLKAQGIENFRAFFAEHPDFIQQAVDMVRIINVNNAAVRMFGAQEKNQLLASVEQIFVPETLEVFVEQLLAITDGETYLESETILKTLQGERLNILFTITFPPSNAKFDSVLVSMMNITARKQAEAAVQASEERLRSFVEANVVGILFGDVEGGISEANDEFLRIVGYTQEDVQTGRLRWTDITPSEYLYLDELAIAEAKAKGACIPFEKEYIRKDDSHVPIVVGYSLLGKSRHKLVALILDISDRQQIEKALHQSEERFQAFMDNSPAAAWITDAKGRVLYLSPTYFRTFHLATNNAINKNIFELYPPEIAQRFLDNIKIVAETNQVIEAIESAPRTDGTLGEFLVYNFPIADTSGQRLVGGVAVDITERERALRERQQAEKALQERSERLKLLSETASDLLSTERPLDLMNSLFDKLSAQMDLDFYFHYLIDSQENQQKLRLVAWNGISEEVFEAIQYLEFHQGMCGQVAQERRQIVVNDVPHSTHANVYILSALNITAYAGQPLIAQGKLLGVLAFGSRTRTHFTPEETALLQATSDQVAVALERADLMASLQRRKEELMQANRIKDEFLAVLSHELRTPLNPILGWSKLLQTKKYDEATTTRALETIERNAKLQTQLIEDLLDVSRILQGKLSLNIAPVNLVTAIATATETVRLAAQAKSINLEFAILDFGLKDSKRNLESENLKLQISKVPLPVSLSSEFSQNPKFVVAGDSVRLQQVIWNLLSNAIKFTPQGGEVEISLKSVGSQVHLQVRDTGKGINADFLPYVFDYFRQADGATTRKFGGLGLGLAIVRHIIELHGGTVKAESLGEEQGATFTVKLPLMKIVLNSQQVERQSDDLPDFNGLKVLLVDDERDTRELIAFILEQSGAVVTQVASAVEALKVLPLLQPNLLLSDIGMPEVDGYMLMRQIRAMSPEQGGQIPAIALTAYAAEIDYQQAIAAGFGQHITKPVEPGKLIRAIANLISCPVEDLSLGLTRGRGDTQR